MAPHMRRDPVLISALLPVVMLVVLSAPEPALAQQRPVLDGPPPPVAPASISRDASGRATLRAHRVREAMRADGRIDEAIYQQIQPISDFVQFEPVNGAPATEKTEVWILFDDDNLYVGGKAYDRSPERWVLNEMRRDIPNVSANESVGFSIDTFLVLLPVFVVILVGLALRLSGLIDGAHWDAVDHVCYYVLLPAIIFKEIAAADFSNVPVFAMAFAMVAAILTMFAMLLAARKPLQSMLAIDGPQFTSLVQGATRWHTFIAFAIIPLYFGPGALALGAVSAAAISSLSRSQTRRPVCFSRQMRRS